MSNRPVRVVAVASTVLLRGSADWLFARSVSLVQSAFHVLGLNYVHEMKLFMLSKKYKGGDHLFSIRLLILQQEEKPFNDTAAMFRRN